MASIYQPGAFSTAGSNVAVNVAQGSSNASQKRRATDEHSYIPKRMRTNTQALTRRVTRSQTANATVVNYSEDGVNNDDDHNNADDDNNNDSNDDGNNSEDSEDNANSSNNPEVREGANGPPVLAPLVNNGQGDTEPSDIASPKPSDPHAHKPLPHVQPSVHSKLRGALCNTVSYYRSHQGSVYYTGANTPKNIPSKAYGMLIDSVVGVRDQFLSQVIITTVGGGRVQDPDSKTMIRLEDQKPSGHIYTSLQTSFKDKLPVVMVAGADNSLWPVRPKNRYNVLDYFHITDFWSEAAEVKGKMVKHWMIRFEKIDLHERSWWTPKDAAETDSYAVGEYRCRTQDCPSPACKRSSKEIFEQGWTCLNPGCADYFKFDPAIPADELRYNESFLRERTRFDGKPFTRALVPSFPSKEAVEKGEKYGTEKEYKDGIVCPKCHACIRRVKWEAWYCETPSCDFSYSVPIRDIPMNQFKTETTRLFKCTKLGEYLTKDRKFFRKHANIKRYDDIVGGYTATTFFLPGEGPPGKDSELKIGSVTVLRPTSKAIEKLGGLDDLYRSMQQAMKDGDVRVSRNPARNAGKPMEELTNHFTVNVGAPYKFGVVVDTTSGFDEAPAPVMESLQRLTWAGETGTNFAKVKAREGNHTVCKESTGDKFVPFNEELILGYFENSAISYHDDGEKELGPTVATLSLGSPAVMEFRPKRRTAIGDERQKLQRPAMLSFVLEHGDMVVMNGTKIHRLYEHKVDPKGIRRYGVTCRYIRPETIVDPVRRQEAIDNGRVPDLWQARKYNGEVDDDSIPVVLEPADDSVVDAPTPPEIPQSSAVEVGQNSDSSTEIAFAVQDNGAKTPSAHDSALGIDEDDSIPIKAPENVSPGAIRAASEMLSALNIPVLSIQLSDQDRFMATVTEIQDYIRANPNLFRQFTHQSLDAIHTFAIALLQHIFAARGSERSA